jgi:hypothetical protein
MMVLYFVHCRFDSAASTISRTPLPSDAIMLGNHVDMLVTLRRRGFVRNGRRAEWNDDSGLGMTRYHVVVNHLGVAGAVSDHRGDWAFKLVEQVRKHREIADVVRSQFRSVDFMSVGIDRKNEFSRAPPSHAMFLVGSLAFAGEIDVTTAPLAVGAGANVLVAGSAIFNDGESVFAAMERLRAAIRP